MARGRMLFVYFHVRCIAQILFKICDPLFDTRPVVRRFLQKELNKGLETSSIAFFFLLVKQDQNTFIGLLCLNISVSFFRAHGKSGIRRN